MTRVCINAILRADPRPGRYGSPMGAMDRVGPGLAFDHRLYLQRVRFVDGDYSADGTYWGGGVGNDNLWCAFTACGKTVRVFVRAYDRKTAKADVLAKHPFLVFLR